MNENRSTIYTTTPSSSIYKKKEENPLGFTSSKQLKHLVSLCTKDTRSYPMCECTICEEYLFADVLIQDGTFSFESNRLEMNKVITSKSVSISYKKGYRTHLGKVAKGCMSLEDFQ